MMWSIGFVLSQETIAGFALVVKVCGMRPDNLVRMAGNLRDINDRKVAEAGLKKRHLFVDLITSISTKFINLPSDEIDAGINDALQAICEFAGVDRAWVCLLSEDQKMVHFTHEWCADGILPTLDRVPQLPVDAAPWSFQHFNRRETVYIPRVGRFAAGGPAG